jgi:hypothetical protein
VASVLDTVGRIAQDTRPERRVRSDSSERPRFPGVLKVVWVDLWIEIESPVVWAESTLVGVKLGLAAADVKNRVVDVAAKECPGSFWEPTEVGAVVFFAAFELCSGEEPDVGNRSVTHDFKNQMLL